MNIIQQELEKIKDEIGYGHHYAEIYEAVRFRELNAVSITLAWVLDPENNKSPYEKIMGIDKQTKEGNQHV